MTSRIARLEVIPVYSPVSSANDLDGTADTVIRRIADFCELMGAEVVPHGWKTGITSAVGRHFQAACPGVAGACRGRRIHGLACGPRSRN
jgi:hypothetical protein